MLRSYSKNSNQTARNPGTPEPSSPKAKKAKRKKKKNGNDPSAEDQTLLIQELERCVGHRFSNADLLLQALTHRSYAQEISPPVADNERLEFLGDAVLQLIVTKRLWSELNQADEGVLTRLRSDRVSGRALAKVARKIGLSGYLRLGKGEQKTGGNQKPSILADALEALVGSIYLDAGYPKCAKLVEKWIWGEESVEADGEAADPKSLLQEELQRRNQRLPVYHVISETGPEHDKMFEIEVRHEKKALGTGRGRNKKEAEQAAALESLLALKKRKPDRTKTARLKKKV